jgi:hypothetical protein
MTELLITATPPPFDGLDGYTDKVEGTENRKNSGLLRGTVLKFGNTAEWEIKDDGEVLGPEIRLILTDVARVVTKWGADKKPAETVVLGHGEQFPDVEDWNDKTPKSEWIDGLNGPRGPWQTQQIVYFVDPRSMAQFSWPTSTTGGAIAIRELMDSVKAMRRFRPGACPLIELSSKFMNTKFGGRQRPHFVIHNWVGLPGNEPQPAALPAPTATVQSVKPVTLQEELNDEIPTFENPKENKGKPAKQRAAKKAAQAST